MKHHYYASCYLGWQTAETEQEAIDGLVKRFNREIREVTKNTQKRGEPGCYIYTCKPADEEYEINYYRPQCELLEWNHYYITWITTRDYAIWKRSGGVSEVAAQGELL